MSVTNMVKSIAVSSANDCACAMAKHIAGSETAFVELMNKRAKELGMNDTHFVNCTGLDDDESASAHRTSAYDIALMSRQLLKYHPEIKKYTTIWMDTVRDGAFGLSNTNKMVRFYNGCTGLKTGFTSGAGYCLSASAQRDGLELVAVVMGCETSQQRFAACKSMLDYGFSNFALITPDYTPQAVAVKLGRRETVDAVLGEDPQFLLEKAQQSSVTTRITLVDGVTAPVSAGQRLGSLTLRVGERVLAELALVAGEGVDRLSFGELFVLALKHMAMAQ
jgi:D-alanyl-D-alanine carboxypeptidase (penicillin-binding protein 5/6)